MQARTLAAVRSIIVNGKKPESGLLGGVACENVAGVKAASGETTPPLEYNSSF
jgi:hypothetical protein